MISIPITHTTADDDTGGELPATSLPLHEQKINNGNNKRKNPPDDQKSARSDMVAMTFQRGQGGGRGRGRGGGAGRGQQHADEVTIARTRAPQTYEEYRDMSFLVNDLKTDPEAGSMILRWIQKQDTSVQGNIANVAKEAKTRIRTKTRKAPRQWMRIELRQIPNRVPQLTPPIPSERKVQVHITLSSELRQFGRRNPPSGP
jgi:uncharacterized sporulation protein YeaH/YhbH (DUF444 family)